MNSSKSLLSGILAITIMAQSSWANIATVQDLLSHSSSNDPLTTINTYLERSEVSGKLEAMGIDMQTAKERVAALNDEEASRLAAEIDTLPAGGDAVGSIVGAAVFIFIVLLITDLLGWTKVFNFTRPIVR
ncbi:MAG: PA2779 family protein [Campylobacterales bacterium]|nr:PA2779 family protein [Campylobacterales bacterium]